MNTLLRLSGAQQQHLSALGCNIRKQGKLYYSLNMARSVIDDWEQDLKPRIDHHLSNLYQAGDLSTQFVLASRHPDENRMTPSVVILCLSKRQRKVILKSFKRSDWDERFREKNLKLRVIIDTEFGEKAGTDRRWALPRLSGPNPEIFGVSLTLPSSYPSLCGARIKLIYPERQGDSRESDGTGRDESKSDNHALATLGGVIAIDGCLYGLTIAHAFGSYAPLDINGGTTLQGLNDSNSSVDTINTYASSGEQSLVDEIDSQFDALSFIDLESQNHPESKFTEPDSDESCNQRGIVVALGLGKYHDASTSIRKLATLHQGPPQHSDWAIVQLEPNFELGNSYFKSGSQELVDIAGVKSEPMLRPEEVWIIAGRSGNQAGALSDATASVNLHKSHFTVRQVRLQHRLECGDSGAWVVQDDKLCGMIIAASGLVPWAYMLPIECVFDDILLTVGGTNITIPSKEEIRNLARKSAFGPSSRLPTDGKGDSKTLSKSSLGSMMSMDTSSLSIPMESVHLRSSPHRSWYAKLPGRKNLDYTPSITTSSSLTLSSQMDYALRLHSYTNSSTIHHIYSRVQFKELGTYLLGAYDSPSQPSSFVESKSGGQSFLFLYELGAESPSRAQGFQSAADFAIVEKSLRSHTASLLFMQGYPSAEWLNTIGGTYHVDPGFYQHHLGSLCMAKGFDRPSMPSYSRDMIRLRITTIGRQDQSCLPSSLNRPVGLLREAAAEKMKEYHRKMKLLNGKAKLGDSIVRQFLSFDEGYFALEQNLTAWIRKRANGWIVIVWLDIGKMLSQSPEGPWLTSDFWSLEHATQLLPTVQSCPVDLYEPSMDNTDAASDPISRPECLVQNASFLPRRYGTTLHTTSMAADPFYALAELFRFVADSEAQFLNFLKTQIEQQQASAATVELQAFHTAMDYTKAILRRHIEALEENVYTIECRKKTNWHPESVPTAQSQSMAEDLLLDFKYLLYSAQKLERSCVDLTTVVTKQKDSDYHELVMVNLRSMRTMTLISLIFLPASFTATFLGMNPLLIREMVSTLVYFVWISTIVTAVSFFAFYRNFLISRAYPDSVKRFWKRGWNRSEVSDATVLP